VMLMAGLALAALGAALALLSPPVVPSRGGAGASAAAAPPWLREASRGASPRLRVNSKGQSPRSPPQLDKIVLQLDYAEQYAESKVLSAESKVLSAEKEVSHLKNLLEAKE
jgi:hypothetical protein